MFWSILISEVLSRDIAFGEVGEFIKDREDGRILIDRDGISALMNGHTEMVVADTFISVPEAFSEVVDNAFSEFFAGGHIEVIVGVEFEVHGFAIFLENKDAGIVGRGFETEEIEFASINTIPDVASVDATVNS